MIKLKEVIIWKAPRPRMHLTPVFDAMQLEYYSRCVDKSSASDFQKVEVAARTGGKLREAEDTEAVTIYAYAIQVAEDLYYVRHANIVKWMRSHGLHGIKSEDGAYGISSKGTPFGITPSRACLVDSGKESMYDVELEPSFYARGVKITPKGKVQLPVLEVSDPVFRKLGAL